MLLVADPVSSTLARKGYCRARLAGWHGRNFEQYGLLCRQHHNSTYVAGANSARVELRLNVRAVGSEVRCAGVFQIFWFPPPGQDRPVPSGLPASST